ncbi:hypothetical protein [Alteromonas flava]|uniref:hypothetical protein n=1 Tax=Alteromonas flava TaxID=2048003 RepID=UPI00196BAE3C|nr:hypothetical protein [Alteromonas flava]
MNTINWDELEHAYGVASDVPDLLAELANYSTSESYDDEPFFSLWSSLCHQGDIYTASYAAVPILISLIKKSPSPVDYNFYLLPIYIHISYLKGKAPSIPDNLKKSYHEAINILPDLAAKEDTNNELMVRVLSSAIAVKSGNAALAETILELSPEIIEEFEEWLQSR